MNEVERLKKEKGGLEVLPDLYRYAKLGYESIADDDFFRLRWYGIYQQKPNAGHFMMRVKIPGGELTAGQARAIGGIAADFGRGFADITTRQNFQFHWLTVESFPEVFSRLDAVGITTSGACGDIARNVTGCPVAGIDPGELFDARPYVQAVHRFFLDNRDFADLPRKYKLSVGACPQHCSQPEINDIAATGVLRDGEEGFYVRVGGGLSARPHLAKKLNMFVPGERLVDVFRAVTEIFRDHGYRDNRKRARLKFLVADWGIEKFESEVRARLGWTPEPAAPVDDPANNFRDHLGVHRQKQTGLNWVGVSVLSGRVTAEQVLQAAEIALEYGSGSIRTTNQQNLLFADVPDASVPRALDALASIGLRHSVSPIRRSAVACTGNEFCNLALTETKQLIVEIVEHLERQVALDEVVRINVNGCPNSCGQHHVGDIGLQGCLVKQGTEKVDGYDLFVGGRLGREAKFVRPIQRKLPATAVKYAIENLLNGYLDLRQEGERFGDFVDRTPDGELARLMQVEFAEVGGAA